MTDVSETDDDDIANLYALFHRLRAKQDACELMWAAILRTLDAAAPQARIAATKDLETQRDACLARSQSEGDSDDLDAQAVEDLLWAINPNRRRTH